MVLIGHHVPPDPQAWKGWHMFGYQIADISDLLDQSNYPFELVLYLTDILSAVTATVAVRSANRDRIPSKPPTRQLVLP